MSPRADSSFFESKREWSKKKDRILDHYLKPYLAKVAKLGKPIVLIDGFAGPGVFDDGEIGSPLILCNRAQEAIDRGDDVRVLCIEKDQGLFKRLTENIRSFAFAEPALGTFIDHIPRMSEYARARTVFLYVDPYSLDGLNWRALENVFKHMEDSDSSIELLLNFMAPTFHRQGWKALKEQSNVAGLRAPELDTGAQDEGEPTETPSLTSLDSVVGGRWWREELYSHAPESQLHKLMEGLRGKLRRSFAHVCYVPIHEGLDSSKTPKYYLVHGTRHPDGLILMNDEMIKATGRSAFDSNMFARSELDHLTLAAMPSQSPGVSRKEAVQGIVQENFCVYESKDIRKSIGDLVKEGKVQSSSDTGQMNKNARVWRA